MWLGPGGFGFPNSRPPTTWIGDSELDKQVQHCRVRMRQFAARGRNSSRLIMALLPHKPKRHTGSGRPRASDNPAQRQSSLAYFLPERSWNS